jgi:hypothetical protein
VFDFPSQKLQSVRKVPILSIPRFFSSSVSFQTGTAVCAPSPILHSAAWPLGPVSRAWSAAGHSADGRPFVILLPINFSPICHLTSSHLVLQNFLTDFSQIDQSLARERSENEGFALKENHGAERETKETVHQLISARCFETPQQRDQTSPASLDVPLTLQSELPSLC